MIRSNLGYVFESKIDAKGIVGIKESFNYSIRDDIQRVTAEFSIDVNGHIVCPSYWDRSIGFSSLATLLNGDILVNAEKFARSNRALFSLASVTYLICVLDLKINTNTKEILDSNINFYLPKVNMPLEKLTKEKTEGWGVLCDIVSSSGKLYTFIVSEGILSGYKQIVTSQLSDIFTGDKKDYLIGRVKGYL